MGDMDFPFEEADYTRKGLPDATVCGGLVIEAAVVHPPGSDEHMAALVFRFVRYDGAPLAPVMLCLLPDGGPAKFEALAVKATRAAARGARKANEAKP